MLGVPGAEALEIPLAPTGPRRAVRVWDDDVDAVEVPGEAAAQISAYLGEPCALVFMPDDVVRPVEAPYGGPADRVGFADGDFNGLHRQESATPCDGAASDAE